MKHRVLKGLDRHCFRFALNDDDRTIKRGYLIMAFLIIKRENKNGELCSRSDNNTKTETRGKKEIHKTRLQDLANAKLIPNSKIAEILLNMV